MAEMLTARVTPAEHAEAHAIAAACDMTLSQMTREIVFKHLPEYRDRGVEIQARKLALPHGVQDAQVEKAMEQLVTTLSRSSAVRLDMSELFSPKSKALYRLLAAVWQEQPGAETKKMLEKFSARVAERLERVGPTDDAPPPVERPKIRDHRRRKSDD